MKGAGRTSERVGQLLQMNPVTVNKWLNRYQASGLAGLETKPGRDHKPVFEPARDLEQVRKAVVEEKQRLSQAKLMLEQQTGKDFSLKMLRRFLKKLSAATNAYAKD